MIKTYRVSLVLPLLLAVSVQAEEPSLETNITAEEQKEGALAFQDIYKVLLHPRCMNCHPAGDAPLQGEDSRPHRMNISRSSTEAGLECAACHQVHNSESYGVLDGPPGAPNWHLPDREMPLIFEGRTPAQLCEQLKNPAKNGNHSLSELVEHVTYDPLVLWGWNPGADRSHPPLAHADFARQFARWAELGGPCPVE